MAPVESEGRSVSTDRLVLGTMTFGDELDPTAAERVVHRAVELGITQFDTANSYGNGLSEEILGRAVSAFRDEVRIASKVGSTKSVGSTAVPRLRAGDIARACDESLYRLGTDYIDTYYLHMPDPNTALAESVHACQDLIAAGKIREFGMSNYAAWQLMDACRICDLNNWHRPRVSQPMYNLIARRIEEEYVDCVDELGILTYVYNPLAGGLLTGKHDRLAGPSSGSRFARRLTYQDRYWGKHQFDAIDRLEEIALSLEMSLIDLSLRWLLNRSFVSGVILGVSSLDQLETNVSATRGPRPDTGADSQIDEVWRSLRGPAPRYNR